MQSNLELIKRIVMNKSTNVIIQEEELSRQMKKISLKFFNEFCDIYLDKIAEGEFILEVHFNDDNYYEIDIAEVDTIEVFSENILRNFIEERFIDKKTVGGNRNNIRYFRKYDQEE